MIPRAFSSGRRRLKGLAGSSVVGAMLLVLHGMAHATLAECRVPEQTPYVVFLSEPSFSGNAFASRERMLEEFNRLHLHLDQRRDSEMAGLVSVPFKVARCVGRVPAIDGADFSADVVRSLYSRSVVIEVWGHWGRAPRADGVVVPKAQMNYLITPVRRAGNEGGLQIPALHRFDYPDGDIRAMDYVNLVSNRDLLAFVVSAIGVMAFDGNEFAKAHQYLCAAEGRLRAVQDRLTRRPEGQAQAAEVERLRGHVSALAKRALVELSRRGPAATSAAASLQIVDRPCGDTKVP